MALSCQMQLFEVFESLPVPSAEKMNDIVKNALNICTIVYILVGVFGYVAFCDHLEGNILLSFSSTLMSAVIKLGFVFSVAFSFPLVIFPCRASLSSLLYHRVSIIFSYSVNIISIAYFFTYFSVIFGCIALHTRTSFSIHYDFYCIFNNDCWHFDTIN